MSRVMRCQEGGGGGGEDDPPLHRDWVRERQYTLVLYNHAVLRYETKTKLLIFDF